MAFHMHHVNAQYNIIASLKFHAIISFILLTIQGSGWIIYIFISCMLIHTMLSVRVIRSSWRRYKSLTGSYIYYVYKYIYTYNALRRFWRRIHSSVVVVRPFSVCLVIQFVTISLILSCLLPCSLCDSSLPSSMPY